MSKAKRSTVMKKSVSGKKKKTKVSDKPKPKVSVAKGIKITKEQKAKLEKKPGSSNTGNYANVSPSNFAGRAGGASPYSFPINTLARAKSALARAHFAPHPEGIQRAVYAHFPQLDPKNTKEITVGGRKNSSQKKEKAEKKKKAAD